METNLEIEKGMPEKPRLSKLIDQLILIVSKKLAWLSVGLVTTIVIQVVMRYVFGKGNVILEELQWHLYGIMIIMALSYGVVLDSHIRVDVASAKFSYRTKAYIDFFGILLLLLPMIWIIFDNSLEFVHASWRVNESSDSPSGLPWRWAFKSFLSIGMFMFALSAVSRLIYMGKIIFCRKSNEKEIQTEETMASKVGGASYHGNK